MKWLKRSAIGLSILGVLVLGGGAAVLWAVGTENGTTWLVRRLLAGAPQLSIEDIRGTLLGGLRLEGVRLRTVSNELDIDYLVLQWDAPAALTRVLAFRSAESGNATYRRVPDVTASGGGPPELPWPLRVEQGSIGTLSITVLERTLVFQAATFATGTYEGRRLVLTDVAGMFGGAALGASATIDLTDDIELEVAGDWSGPLAGVAASGTVELAGTWPDLTIRHELTAPFAATTTGTMTTGPFRVDVVNEWQDLAWPGVVGVASPNGRLALAGSLDDYRYDGSGTVDILGRPAGFTVEGTGQRLLLALARLELMPTAPGSGSLQGTGSLDLESRETTLEVTATRFDPVWIVGAWPGRLDGTARLRAGLRPEPNAALDAIALAGELRGYPVTLRGAAAVMGSERYRLDALRLDSGANRVVLTGALDRERLDLDVEAKLDELDLLVPDVDGALTANLAIDGTWREPRADGEIALHDVTYADVTVQRLDVRGAAGLAADARVDLDVAAAGLARGPVRVSELDAIVDGTAGAHAARIELTAEGVDLSAAATGGLAAGVWRGMLDRLDIDEKVLGPWRLESPTAVGIGRGFVTVGNACLKHVSNARWCSELDLQGKPEDKLVVSGQNFELASLKPLLPPEVELAGVYQLSGSLFDLMGDPRGAVALTGGTTRARVVSGDEAFATELDLVQAGMTLTSGRLALTATVRRAAGGSADVDAEIADVRARDSRVNGAVRVEWPDVGFLTLLSPELERVAGAIAVNLDVGGTVAEPTLDGRAVFSNGRIEVPRWGLAVEDIEASASSSEGRSLAIDATGRAGDGVLTLAGTTELDPDSGWPTQLTLRGDTVRVVQLPTAEIFASPDLNVNVALPLIEVTGRVHIPRAAISLDVLPSQAVTPSPDAVVHGNASTERSRPLQLKTVIEFTLGDDVKYSGLNLDTTVGGELRVTMAPDASTNATGTLRLDGTYDAYGQKLEIEQGQLLFSGPLDDPGLDVRALRDLENNDFTSGVTEVGVELTGTLKNPRTRVFSTPSMTEADALSYLLFGRPMSGSNAGGLDTEQSSTLQTAALTLGLQQALPVVQRFGNTLGLDELTVQSTETDAGALMAGKYLSPRVYIRYSYGLFNRIGGFLLRFKVNDRLSIETRSGEQESMDLFYTIEKE
ncbi:MAG TPA: translocation/assembly module TamB domain-containing protein [Gammaproteobacteria bacterium]|nr:translocation/assembly module TamB domain-containing protein [Gammaproteobacteria bacterium]